MVMERIIHGYVVDIVDYPYQVALVAQRGERKRIICGGALIKPNVVFTAAHCTHATDHEERENLAVLVGANYVDDPKGRLHSIDKMTKHPDFSFNDFDHDFSVITLNKEVEFGPRAQPIEVSSGKHLGGTVARVSGWGRTETGQPSKYLRATQLTVEVWERCQNYFPGVFHPTITKNMICVRPDRTTTYFVSFCLIFFDQVLKVLIGRLRRASYY